MKVLQVIHNLELAGAEVLVRDLVIGLNRRGVECSVYLLQSTGSQLERSLRLHLQKQMQGRETDAAVYGKGRSSLYSPLQPWRLAAHLRAHRYDIVHVHLFPAQFWAAAALKFANLASPLMITEHSSYNYRRRPIYRPLDRWIYAQFLEPSPVSAMPREMP